jgi:hypothetical protein
MNPHQTLGTLTQEQLIRSEAIVLDRIADNLAPTHSHHYATRLMEQARPNPSSASTHHPAKCL